MQLAFRRNGRTLYTTEVASTTSDLPVGTSGVKILNRTLLKKPVFDDMLSFLMADDQASIKEIFSQVVNREDNRPAFTDVKTKISDISITKKKPIVN